VFRYELPHVEVLSASALTTIEHGWRRIVAELGIEFLHDETLQLLRDAGQRVVDTVVHFDPDWVLEQVAKAPTEFILRARNPHRSVRIGGRSMVFAPVSGAPFFRDGQSRREGTLADYELIARLVQHYDELDVATMPMVEPGDRPLDSRHLDMFLASATLTDKPFLGSALSAYHAQDSIELARLLHRGQPMVEVGPNGVPTTNLMTIVNVNSPLRYDTGMLEALLAYARAGQAVIVTPFLLMGAMSPVTVPSALTQQTAEALTGVALTQLVRPGTPVVLGSFLSTIDMQSGSPSFGGPESAIGLYASGQIARRYGLPWRAGGGGLTASQTVDAQAGYEAFNTLLACFQSGANIVMQSAGWLESGLVSCPDKLVMDVEILRLLRRQFTPLDVDEDALAFEAHDEVRHGGHFLGAMHTLQRFRDCFYRPMLASTDNFERWTSRGGLDTAARAGMLWRAAIEGYVQPDLDPTVHADLVGYAARRRHELGDD
jgi:trimethylamine--corrinoid protein Co-methyltransferase